jgi:hypothetical protein
MKKVTLQELGKIFFLAGMVVFGILAVMMIMWMFTEQTMWILGSAGFGLILLSFGFLSAGSRIGKQ